MSSALVMTTPVGATAKYREVLAQIDRERFGKSLADPALASEYAAELSEGFQYLAETEAKVEGQKALHGAYIYGLLATTAVRGKIMVDGVKVPLGTVVGQRLGRWMGERDSDGRKIMVPLASGSVTRYRYISVLVLDCGYGPEDPDWSDLVNYYVSNPAMTALLKQSRPATHKDGERKITRSEVEAVIATLRAPRPALVQKADDIKGEVVTSEDDTDTDTDSQDPENPEDKGEDKGEDSAPEDPTPTPQAPGPIPAHEIDLPRGLAGKVQYLEAIAAGLAAERTNLSADLLKKITVVIETLQVVVS